MEESPAPITETKGTTGGPVVKTFASGTEVPLVVRVRIPVGAEVGAILIILQITVNRVFIFYADTGKMSNARLTLRDVLPKNMYCIYHS